MIRYVAYGRFSTDLQNDKSAADQIAACDERAKTFEDWVKVGEYADEGLTGDTMHKRRQLHAVISDAAAEKFDVLMVESIDRFSRRSSEGHYIYEKLQFHDVQIYSLIDNDFVTDMHMAWRMFEGSQYLKKLKENVKQGQRRALERGGLVGSIPYGYSVERTTAMPRGMRVVVEDEAKIVRRIFAEYALGMSPIKIVKRLNDEKVPSPDGKTWRQCILFGHAGRTGGMLTNEHYRGIYRWGMTERRRNPDTGVLVVRKTDPSQVKEVALPAELKIVDDETWNAVQARVAERRRVPLPRRKLPKHLLSGLLSCGICKNSYTVSDTKRCACSGRTEMGTCTNRRRVDRAELETAVLALLHDTLLNPALIDSYIKTYRAEHKRLLGQLEAEGAATRKRLEKGQKELDRLVSAVASEDSGDGARAVLMRAIQSRTEELETLQQEAGATKVCQLPVYDSKEIVERLKEQVTRLRGCLFADNPDSTRARETVRTLIDKVTIYPEGEADGRGCGPVRVEIEGRITALLDFANGASDRVVQLGLGTESRLNHATWRASTVIENGNKVRKIRPSLNTDVVLDFLRNASAPTYPKELVSHIVQSCGLDHSERSLRVAKARVQRSLDYLRVTGQAVVVPVPGMRKFLWALAEREHEFWPDGVPAQAGNYADTDKVLDVLGRATRLLTVTDITRQVAIASGEQPRKKRLNYLGTRVRGCLHFLRTQGIVLQVTFTGTQKQGWLLASRQSELVPDASAQPDGRVANDATVLSILASLGAPMTAAQIAEAMLAVSGDPPTEINMRRAVYRVRHHLRRFQEQGLVCDVKTKGSTGLWTLAAPPVQAESCEAAILRMSASPL